MLGFCRVDLNFLYPDADEGDFAYIDFEILTDSAEDIFINVTGNLCLYFNDELVFSFVNGVADRVTEFRSDSYNIPVKVSSEKRNFVRIKCIKHNGEFGCRYNISIRPYPGMWANDYIARCSTTPPIDEFFGEGGVAVSRLYKRGEQNEKVVYEYPKSSESCHFDFYTLYAKGDAAYVYAKAKKEHTIKNSIGTISKIWINGKKACEGDIVKKDDDVLYLAENTNGKWYADIDEDLYYLPFLKSNRKHSVSAVCIGPFYGDKKHSPEYELNFDKIYTNEKGERIFWEFSDASQLRIHLDSVFFGQWFYALMVGFYGIRKAGQALEKEEYENLFNENMHYLAKYLDYVRFDASKNVMPPFMPRTIDIKELDNIGTMGMNFIDSYFDTNNKLLEPVIKELRDCMVNNVPCFSDGTFYRVKTMWADDLFMSCPFAARLGLFENDAKWYHFVRKQVEGFYKRLYNKDKNIFSHIFFVDENTESMVAWGRGNGWVMWTLTELLQIMEAGEDFDAILALYKNFVKGIVALQGENGMWRQVLDSTDYRSYYETSCTAMFMLGLTRGVKNKWIDKTYIDNIDKAWEGILKNSIDKNGNIYGVCMGSGCSMDKTYYYNIPTTINDDHGTGIVLTAASEYYMLKNNILK